MTEQEQTAVAMAALRLGQLNLVDVAWGDANMSSEVFAEFVIRGPLYTFSIGGARITVWHGHLSPDDRRLVNQHVVRVIR